MSHNFDFRWCRPYLSDVNALLNKLNLSMQGQDINILYAQEKLNAFLAKLSVWSRRIVAGSCATWKRRFSATEIRHPGEIIQSHLDMLSVSFDRYFSPATEITDAGWIHSPCMTPYGIDDTHAGKEELIEVKSREVFRFGAYSKMRRVLPTSVGAREAFLVMGSLVLNACIPFVSIYARIFVR